MSLFGLELIVIYIIIWWLILFITLPFGIRKDDTVIEGNDPGAPKKTLLKKKIFITSIISLILTFIFSFFKNALF